MEENRKKKKYKKPVTVTIEVGIPEAFFISSFYVGVLSSCPLSRIGYVHHNLTILRPYLNEAEKIMEISEKIIQDAYEKS